MSSRPDKMPLRCLATSAVDVASRFHARRRNDGGSLIRLASTTGLGLFPGRIEAGQVAIGFGILRPANPLAVFDDARTATRLPGGARLLVGLLFFRRSRRRGAKHCAAVDFEVGGLAGGQRPS